MRDHPEVASRRLDAHRFVLSLPGTVRLAVPVAVEVGERTCTFSSFLLRGPRAEGDAARLHRLLLRRNLGSRRLRFALDGDDDVVLVGRMAVSAVTADAVEEVLAEVLSVSDGAFEALVHLAYPGVFPPLARLRPPG